MIRFAWTAPLAFIVAGCVSQPPLPNTAPLVPMSMDGSSVTDSFAALGFLAVVGNLIFLGVIVLLVVWAVKYLGRPKPPANPPWPGTAAPPPVGPASPDPHDILRERFARGEITLEEFQTARQALGSSDAPPPASSSDVGPPG
jgi:Short C-terminal domain